MDIWMIDRQADRQTDSLVTATWRLALPSSITSITSSGLETKRSVHPWGHRATGSSLCRRNVWMLLSCRAAELQLLSRAETHRSNTPWQTAPGSCPRAQTGWSLSLKKQKRKWSNSGLRNLDWKYWTILEIYRTEILSANHPEGHGFYPCRSQSRKPEGWESPVSEVKLHLYLTFQTSRRSKHLKTLRHNGGRLKCKYKYKIKILFSEWEDDDRHKVMRRSRCKGVRTSRLRLIKLCTLMWNSRFSSMAKMWLKMSSAILGMMPIWCGSCSFPWGQAQTSQWVQSDLSTSLWWNAAWELETGRDNVPRRAVLQEHTHRLSDVTQQ